MYELTPWTRVPYRVREAWKQELAARDGLMCCICLRPIPSYRAATVEHKKKRRNGGTNHLHNLGLAHAACNYADRDTTHIKAVNNNAFFWREKTP
ncbi:HNH endonuclease [Dermabacteraceae bacterium P7006]